MLSVPAALIFGIVDLLAGRTLEGLFVIGIVVVLGIGIVMFQRLQNILMASRIVLACVLALLTCVLAIGGGGGYAYLWLFFYPLAAFFIFGQKEGFFWVLASLLLSSVFLFTDLGTFQYPLDAAARFVVTYSLVSGLTWGLESTRNRYYSELNDEKESLQRALNQVKTLQGLLPICASCKKIRDDKGYWNQLETYLHKHSDAQFTHGCCPECAKVLYSDLGRR